MKKFFPEDFYLRKGKTMKETKVLVCLIITLLIPSQLLAAGDKRPFDPAFAADQEIITSESIQFESQQFQRMGDWLIARDQVETKRLEKQQAQDVFDRTRNLHQKGLATDVELAQAEYGVQQADSALEIALSQLRMHKANGLKSRFLLLGAGNPGEDYRLEVAMTQKQAQQETGKIFESQLSGARAGVRFWTMQVERDRKLFEKRLIKKSQLERSELILKMSQEQLATIGHKISSNKLTIQGLEKTIRALSEG